MKYLLPPAFAVLLSTAGVAFGCHAAGMPSDDLAIAVAVAGSVASVTAFGATLLARPRRMIQARGHGLTAR